MIVRPVAMDAIIGLLHDCEFACPLQSKEPFAIANALDIEIGHGCLGHYASVTPAINND